MTAPKEMKASNEVEVKPLRVGAEVATSSTAYSWRSEWLRPVTGRLGQNDMSSWTLQVAGYFDSVEPAGGITLLVPP